LKIQLRKDRMSKGERWEALLNRKPLDRIPVNGLATGGFAAVHTGLSIVDAYNNPQMSFEAQMRTAEKFGSQDIPGMIYASYGGWEFGGEIRWPSGEFAQAPTVLNYPVKTDDDAWKLEVPDIKTAGIIPIVSEIVDHTHKSGSPYLWSLVGGPFTMAGMICQTETLCRWMIKKPEVAHRLLRLATDFCVGLAQYWVDRYVPERIIPMMGEPSTSNQVISPRQFKQFALPYIEELHKKQLSMGIKHLFHHICGEQNANLSYWASIPFGDPGIVSVGHEVDLETASRHFPNDIIMGNVEPALLQTGTPEQVYEAAKACIEKGVKHPGGFMLAPGCEMPPMACEENIWAMMQAVNDFGWYE
jgi:uroporphyrinogen decarboxylase